MLLLNENKKCNSVTHILASITKKNKQKQKQKQKQNKTKQAALAHIILLENITQSTCNNMRYV